MTRPVDLVRLMELQAKAEKTRLTASECVELYALELAWHNAFVTDADAPVRAVP